MFFAQGSKPKAQSNGGVTLTPSLIIMEATPGEQKIFSINFSNNEGQDLLVDTRFTNLENIDASTTNGSSHGEADWLSVLSDNLLLKVNEVSTLSFSLQVPTDAKSKGYFPVILFSFRSINSGGDIGVFTEIAVPVYLNVATEEDFFPKLELGLNVTKLSVFGTKAKIEASILNSSNTFALPKGRIVISDTRGDEFSEVFVLNEENSFLLPGQEINKMFSWENEDYSLLPQVGKYKVRLELFQNGQEVSQTEYSEFLVLPYQYFLYTLLILLTITFVSNKLLRKKDRKGEPTRLKTRL